MGHPWVIEECAGASDRHVLQLAREQQRWLVSFDRGYGDLVFRQAERPPPGIVYLRMVPVDALEPARAVEDALRRFEGEGLFLAVGRNSNVRERKLPE